MRRQHEWFQDAVNYYFLSLAAMAGGLRPMREDSRLKEIEALEEELRVRSGVGKGKRAKRSNDEKKQDEELTKKLARLRMEESVWQWRLRVEANWEQVERGADVFPGPKARLGELPKLDLKGLSFEQACQKVIEGSKASPQLRAEALLRLLELTGEAAGDDGAALTPRCREKIAWMCNRRGALDATDDVTVSKAENAAWKFAQEFHKLPNTELEAMARKLEPANFMTRERGESRSGPAALETLLDYARVLVPKAAENKTARSEIAQFIRSKRREKEELHKFEWRMPGAKVSLDYKAATVFKIIPRAGVAAVLRVKTGALAKRKDVPILDRDGIADARVDDTPHFDYFSNIAFTAPPKAEKATTKKRKKSDEADGDDEGAENRAHWFEFDLAAFVEAFKAPHRYCRDTIKRNEERAKLLSRIVKMDGAGEKADDTADDTTESLPGFSDDPRIELIRAKDGLIRDSDLLGWLETAEEAEDESYPIHENTLRGWGKLRRAWREAAEKSDFNGEDELNSIRLEQQGERPEEAGGGGLFKVLQKEKYWSIWKDDPEKGTNQAEDPLWAWVRYCEMKADVERLDEPIRFTPAHATYSPRFFIFPKQSREKKVPDNAGQKPGLKSDHLRGMFARNDEGEIIEITGKEEWLGDRPRLMAFAGGILLDTEKGIQPTPARFYFTAPRLRRDCIRRDGEGNLGKAAMLQPMIEVLGIDGAEPVVNFANCAVMLLAEPERGADENELGKQDWRICLGFPVSVDAEKLREHPLFQHHTRWSYRPSGKGGEKNFAQFRYSAKEPRREISLRWPIDEQHDKEAQEKDSNRKGRKALDRAWYCDNDGRFTCLPVDLGQRVGGAFAVLDARANDDFGKNKKGEPIPSRYIGETDGKKWRATVIDKGLLTLPGEDYEVFRPRKKLDDRKPKDTSVGKRFREELWGDRGRPALRACDTGALRDETLEAHDLLVAFDQLDIMPDGWDERGSKPSTELSFPEQNDYLLRAARRFISRIRRLHRWCAFLCLDDKEKRTAERKKRTLEEIREACGLDESGKAKIDEKTKEPAPSEAWLEGTARAFVEDGKCDPRLKDGLADLLRPMPGKLCEQMEKLANRCVPLRGRSWLWQELRKDEDGKPLHILRQTGGARPTTRMKMTDGSEQDVTWIRGQRGLSAARIEQIEILRRVLQSVNHIQRREIGEMPKRRARGETGVPRLPDCCPGLLEKLDEMKEQRVNQLAHQILALALGVRLKREGPGKSSDERTASDIHGEYERIPCKHEKDGFRRPVDFIVLEDLEYYQTTRMRSRRENTRLMRWCRRHFRNKLKQLCEIVGIPIVEANPADTSKFCSRSGVAGFRAVEVGPGFEKGFVWKKALEKLKKSTEAKTPLDKDELVRCKAVEKLVEQMKQAATIPTKDGTPRTLLAPDGAGNVFVPVAEIDGKYKPAKKGDPVFRFLVPPSEEPDGVLRPAMVQADIGAAITLGLRAIADPTIWEIHPRVRTTRTAGKLGKPKEGDEKPALNTRESRKYGPIALPLDVGIPTPNSAVYETRQPNYYRDRSRAANWDKAHFGAQSGNGTQTELVSGKALWGAVRSLQWERCDEINRARIQKWARDGDDEDEDQIPGLSPDLSTR